MMAEKIIEVEPDVAEVFLAVQKEIRPARSFSLAGAPMNEIPASERFCSPML